MDITWLGHACFRLKGSGLTVVTDPFDDSQPFTPGPIQADAVTVSNPGPSHSSVSRVQGVRKALRAPGEYELSDVFILGVRTFLDSSKGAERGVNTVFRLSMDGLRLCHLGAIGHVPSSDQASSIGDVDILFVPVGGGESLSASQAAEVVGQLEPKVVIPMQYGQPGASGEGASADAFLKEMGTSEVEESARYSVTSSNIPGGSPRVVLLEPVDGQG